MKLFNSSELTDPKTDCYLKLFMIQNLKTKVE